MKIVIVHLTRMAEGYFCAAGVEPETLCPIRPVHLRGRLPTDLLARHGGPFDVANVIDLGLTLDRSTPPHKEDRLFNPDRAKLIEQMDGPRFLTILDRISKRSLLELFGADLEPAGQASCGVRENCGGSSLGCLVPARPPRLFLEPGPDHHRIRAVVSDGRFNLSLGVTDIRLYRDDHVTPDPDKVKALNQQAASHPDLVLALGLTRPYQPSSGQTPLCWLQVNNIHPRAASPWRLD